MDNMSCLWEELTMESLCGNSAPTGLSLHHMFKVSVECLLSQKKFLVSYAANGTIVMVTVCVLELQ